MRDAPARSLTSVEQHVRETGDVAVTPPQLDAAWPQRRRRHWTDRLIAFLQRSRITPLVLAVLVGAALFGVYRNQQAISAAGPAEIRAEAATDLDLGLEPQLPSPDPPPPSSTSVPSGVAVGALGLDPSPDDTTGSAFQAAAEAGELATPTTDPPARPTAPTVSTTTTVAARPAIEEPTTTVEAIDTTTASTDDDGGDDNGDDDGGQSTTTTTTTTTTTVAEVPAVGPGCEAEGSIRSDGAGNLIEIFIRNARTDPVEIHWIDYDGRRSSYGLIEPGTTLSRPTFEQHPWLVADQDGTCLRLISGAADRSLIEIR